MKTDKNSQMYKLIFLDFSMQGMDGPEVAQKIRFMLDEESIAQPFICCCTAYVEEQYQKEASASGMDHFLTKPLNDNDIRAILSKVHV